MDGMSPITGGDISEAVRSTAMLADVTISMWGAERTDDEVMSKIKADAGAVGNVGRAIKNLLAGADGLLKDTHGAFRAVRSVHYGLTLPWVTNPHAERLRGPRLLTTALWDEYTTKVAQARSAAYTKLDEFIAAYPDCVEQARRNLGTMADAVYPTAEEVKGKFAIVVDFEPIPAGAAFKGLSSHTLDKLAASLQRRQERMISTAQTAVWEKVRERVGHLTNRLSDPSTRFKASTIENARELVTLLPGWNVTGDPRLEEIASDIAKMLTGVEAESLRKDESARKDVSVQAQGITDKLAQWGL